MRNRISESDFRRIVMQVNDTLYSYYACPLCFYFGYLCCMCTLGLSFVPACVCIKDAEREARAMIERLNNE